MTRRTLAIPLCSVLAVASLALRAQGPSNWTTTTLPANLLTQPSQIGTILSFFTTNEAWLYSGVTKQWTVIPVSLPGTIFQANDYCIVRDGNLLHGFATHTNTVSTITVSGNETVVSGPSSSSWVTLVADGTQAYAFGAFHGQWETLALSQPNPTMVSSRLTGLLLDGTTAYGVSAHHGTFVPVAADASATLQVVGEAEVGTANSPGVFRAFSTQQNTWGVQAVPIGASEMTKAEYAMVWSGTQVWAFSGLTGTMATLTANQPVAAITGGEGVAGFNDGNDVVCYGSGRGTFARFPAPGATLQFDYHFALLDLSGLLVPFSAITCTFGLPIAGTFFITTNDDAAYFDGGTQTSYAYSPILNRAVAAPVSAPTFSVLRDVVVLVTNTGYEAFSARHGNWVSRPTTLIGSYQAPISGSSFAAFDGISDVLHVFDARLDRWATLNAQGPLQVNISRHTVMAHDGQAAYGFGQPSGEWFAVPLTAAPTNFRTSSSLGSIQHGNELSIYCVQGSFSYTGRYPEFTQAINLGNTLTLHQVAPAGSLLFRAWSFRPAYLPVPGFGTLYLDPTIAVGALWPQAVPANGLLEILFPLPNNPVFAGTQLHMQNLVLPPAGQPWLSSSVAPVLF